jgi:hypothetical protein
MLVNGRMLKTVEMDRNASVYRTRGGLFFLRMRLRPTRPALQRKNLRAIKLPLKIVSI